MVGFNYKSLVLQIIHGSVLLGTIIFVIFKSCSIDEYYNDVSNLTLIFSVFLLASYVIGVIIDFLADCVESFFIRIKLLRPPIFYLLYYGKRCGIVLAHNTYILKKLCRVASKYYEEHENKQKSADDFFEGFNNKKRKTVNYILQVAKNRAFRKCKEGQKDQIDSFFMLYVFSRNIALSLLISSGLLFYGFFYNAPEIPVVYGFVFLFLSLFFIPASYRYYLYYLRILLGSSFKIKCL